MRIQQYFVISEKGFSTINVWQQWQPWSTVILFKTSTSKGTDSVLDNLTNGGEIDYAKT